MRKILTIFAGILTLVLALLYFGNKEPETKYIDLTRSEASLLKNNSINSLNELKQVYESYSKNVAFDFPRQKCNAVKLYKNQVLFKFFRSQELKPEYVDSLLKFFNSPENFDWAETTWQASEAEYVFHFYGSDNLVIGKLLLCLYDCNMVESTPFCPNMKFGHMNKRASKEIRDIIRNSTFWQ